MFHLMLACAVAAADQAAKFWIGSFMPLGVSRPVWPGVFSLTRVANPGAAFGILQYRTPLFIGLGLAIIAAAIVFRKKIDMQPTSFKWGLGLVLGGALGNLIDRLRSGMVCDYLDFHWWPIFNLADIAIFCGAGLLILIMLTQRQSRMDGG